MKIKLALCQMNVIDNKKANIETATSMIIDSANNDADFIVFPKCLTAHIQMTNSSSMVKLKVKATP